MNVLTFDYQTAIRLGAFCGVFLCMAGWETMAPRRIPRASKGARWFTNLSVTFFNSLIAMLVLALPCAAAAMGAQAEGWGVLNWLQVPAVPAGLVSVVVLDLAIYGQHAMFHKVKVFWPIHGMHHTDLDVDVTTGARFHPVEIVLSLLIKMGIIVIVGVAAWAFLVFEVLLNGTSMFNHGNVRMNAKVDRVVRRFVVTPDMHRVHHSVIIREHDSNFGFNLPWWDRLFGTYNDQPREGHDNMTIGLANFRDPRELSFVRLLALPFVRWRKF